MKESLRIFVLIVAMCAVGLAQAPVRKKGSSASSGEVNIANTSELDGLSVTRNATGSGTTFTATSSGSNAGFRFTPKGTGNTTLTTGQLILGALSGVGLVSAAPHALSNNVVKATNGTTGWTDFEASSIDVGTTSSRTAQLRGDSGSLNFIRGARIGWNSSTTQYNGGANETHLENPAPGVVGLLGTASVGGTFRALPVTASQLTADTNNYNPGRSMFLRLSSDASRTITGFNPGAGTNQNGEVHYLLNVGSEDIVIANESASSTAANRFTTTTGANVTLSAKQACLVVYDGTASRWLVFKLT
jgi:hypothetical protein